MEIKTKQLTNNNDKESNESKYDLIEKLDKKIIENNIKNIDNKKIKSTNEKISNIENASSAYDGYTENKETNEIKYDLTEKLDKKIIGNKTITTINEKINNIESTSNTNNDNEEMNFIYKKKIEYSKISILFLYFKYFVKLIFCFLCTLKDYKKNKSSNEVKLKKNKNFKETLKRKTYRIIPIIDPIETDLVQKMDNIMYMHNDFNTCQNIIEINKIPRNILEIMRRMQLYNKEIEGYVYVLKNNNKEKDDVYSDIYSWKRLKQSSLPYKKLTNIDVLKLSYQIIVSNSQMGISRDDDYIIKLIKSFSNDKNNGFYIEIPDTTICIKEPYSDNILFIGKKDFFLSECKKSFGNIKMLKEEI